MRKPLITILIFFVVLYSGYFALSANLELSQKILTLIPKEAKHNGKLGVVVKSINSDESFFEYNPEKLFIPASNMKVIISAAALSILNKDYRFKTVFYSGGEISNGILNGGLYIKGFGDPTLDTNDLTYIAQQLLSKGVKKVKGGIIVDDSYFGKIRYGRGWKKRWRGDAFSPPISAITLNFNTFEINVSPTKLGRAPQVKLGPVGTNINIINKAVTSNKKGSISTYWTDEGSTVVVRGRISPRRTLQTFELAVMNPALYMGDVFKSILEESGIEVDRSVVIGTVPKWSKHIYTHDSVPLSLIINEYNKESVNVIGENLMKTLGAHFMGAPGTWEKGELVISNFLIGIGINGQFRIVDGSGLSTLNRISPQTLTEVLKFAYTNRFIGKEFVNSLPIAGVDGTLEKRFRRSKVEGRVFAKTGYLNNVRALSGYVFAKSGEVLVFSILSNGVGWKAKSFQNELLKEMVECCNIKGSFNN